MVVKDVEPIVIVAIAAIDTNSEESVRAVKDNRIVTREAVDFAKGIAVVSIESATDDGDCRQRIHEHHIVLVRAVHGNLTGSVSRQIDRRRRHRIRRS